MENRMTRRRESLFTVEEMAREMECSSEEVIALEESFLSPLQRKYLSVIRYSVGFYPRRKKRERVLMANGGVGVVFPEREGVSGSFQEEK